MNASSFEPGQTVTVLRGDDIACRPYLFVKLHESGVAHLLAPYGAILPDIENVRAWSQDYQDDWAAWLEGEALKAERVAAELRSTANLAKLSFRNASLEAAGLELRRVVYAIRTEPEFDYEVLGYWADGHDWTGKRELIPADGTESLYLFDDEVLGDESWPR